MKKRLKIYMVLHFTEADVKHLMMLSLPFLRLLFFLNVVRLLPSRYLYAFLFLAKTEQLL